MCRIQKCDINGQLGEFIQINAEIVKKAVRTWRLNFQLMLSRDVICDTSECVRLHVLVMCVTAC